MLPFLLIDGVKRSWRDLFRYDEIFKRFCARFAEVTSVNDNVQKCCRFDLIHSFPDLNGALRNWIKEKICILYIQKLDDNCLH